MTDLTHIQTEALLSAVEEGNISEPLAIAAIKANNEARKLSLFANALEGDQASINISLRQLIEDWQENDPAAYDSLISSHPALALERYDSASNEQKTELFTLLKPAFEYAMESKGRHLQGWTEIATEGSKEAQEAFYQELLEHYDLEPNALDGLQLDQDNELLRPKEGIALPDSMDKKLGTEI